MDMIFTVCQVLEMSVSGLWQSQRPLIWLTEKHSGPFLENLAVPQHFKFFHDIMSTNKKVEMGSSFFSISGMQSRYLCKVLYYWQALQYMLMTELVLQTATDIQHSKDTSKSCNIFGIQNSCNVLTSTRHALLELSSYIDGKNLIFPCLGSTMNRYCSLEMMKFLFKSKNRNKRLLKMSLL